jgi:hypothetical protein
MSLRSFLPLALLAAGCSSTVVEGTGGEATTPTTTSNTTETTSTGTCGGESCGSGGYCHWTSAACMDTSSSGASFTGVCQPRPDVCYDTYAPVCGCDGKMYPNVCWANMAGVDVGSQACSASVTPDQYIPCGTLYCDPSSAYCSQTDGDEGDEQWACKTLPSSCTGAATPDCSCFGTLTGGMVCQVVQGNGVSGLEVDMPAQ